MERATAIAGFEVVVASEAWCVARGKHVYVVVLDGVIDDAASTAWQRAAGDDLLARGFPHFGFVLFVKGTTVTTLSNRMKTASFARGVAAAMKQLVVVANTHQSFVIHSILRVAGISNIRFVGPGEASDVLAAVVAGKKPF
jgi:hypothetical protein